MSGVPLLSFFIGKGGVGKTTVSSAYAAHIAQKHPRRPVLLVSTDPAHSLGDIFQERLAGTPRRVRSAKGKLLLWQINAQTQFKKFLDRYREGIFALLESGTIFSRQEIEPLLSTTLPGMAEIAALLAIHDALTSGDYDEIVVDTAPIGHTQRLFEMPEHFARFLDFLEIAGSRDQVLAQTFGGSAAARNVFVAEWRSMVETVEGALRSKNSRLVLVTTGETFSLREAVRSAQALAEGPSRLRITGIVLNRVPGGKEAAAECKFCAQRQRATRSAKEFLRRHFARVPLWTGEDSGSPLLGAAELAKFGAHVFAGSRAPTPRLPETAGTEIALREVEWPKLSTPLSLTVGKGGVGKTTISAALACQQRKLAPKIQITVCSTDPAPSLDDVFRQPVGDRAASVLGDPGLQAAEIDSVSEFKQWADAMKEKVARAFSSEQRGVHLDLSLERRLFAALLDIVPPGVDEIFAIFRIMDLLNPGEDLNSGAPNARRVGNAAQRVIIDMAPTGHALELLRMPERILLWSRLLLKSLAAHRTLPLAQDVAVEIAELSQRVRQLAARLKDKKESALVAVMLAEPLPDRETQRLLHELGEMGANVAALVVNRVLFKQDMANCLRCQRARRWQLAMLAGLRKRSSLAKILVVRNHPREIAGRAALQSLRLWQLEKSGPRVAAVRAGAAGKRGSKPARNRPERKRG